MSKRSARHWATMRHVSQRDVLKRSTYIRCACCCSYLVDPVVRAAMHIDVSGAVLIFDEAHNIEDTARQGVRHIIRRIILFST